MNVVRKIAFLASFVIAPTLIVCVAAVIGQYASTFAMDHGWPRADAEQFMWALYGVALIGFGVGAWLIAEDEQ